MGLLFKEISKPENHSSQCLVLGVYTGAKLSKAAKAINKASASAITRLLKRGDIEGKAGDALLIPHLEGVKADRVLLIGCGGSKKLTRTDAQKLIESVFKQLDNCTAADACLMFDELSVEGQAAGWLVEQLALKMVLNSYQYKRTLSKPATASCLKRLSLGQKADSKMRLATSRGTAIGKGMNIARELGNLPANICTPSYLASQAKAMAKKYPALKVKILEEKQMAALGMGSLLSVSAGSKQPAKLIVLEHKGGKAKQQPHVLVGKGVTFDSGGISIKPGARMDEMKYDMCGAASVIGTMETISLLKLPINITAVVGAVENMPGGKATKPGDVVTSMSGHTIEVLNTDAEGRLVLCDALSYAERFKPQSIIDVATLTGACVVALGKHATGLYSNQDDFAEQLFSAGEQIGDRAWHMPLWDEYQPQLKSNFADIANIGGPEGGSITAACFLSRFTENMRWAHLDIAGTAWHSGANKGATGRPVGLLSQYLINQSDSKTAVK